MELLPLDEQLAVDDQKHTTKQTTGAESLASFAKHALLWQRCLLGYCLLRAATIVTPRAGGRGERAAIRGGLYFCSLGGQLLHSMAPPIRSRAAAPQPM
ncbi:hypothetical protein EYF80_041493 [Liparis tanakae]|uniref:Uncharacterized protein n=1 Tax=Liparis tanakae TaxID=230148 RepID=A0A4Z2G5Y5_9TELE|nr:hypothetical protein EYF80_041493 [Liparis tanakae]